MRRERGFLILLVALTLVLVAAVPATAATPTADAGRDWRNAQWDAITVDGPAWIRGVLWSEQSDTMEILWRWHQQGLIDEPRHVTVHLVDQAPGWAPWAAGWVPFAEPTTVYMRTQSFGDRQLLAHELFHTLWAPATQPQTVTEGLAQVFAADRSFATNSLWDQAAGPDPHQVVYEPDDGTYWPRRVSQSTPTLHYHEAYLSVRSLLLHLGRDEFLRRVRQMIDGRMTWQDLYNLDLQPTGTGGER